MRFHDDCPEPPKESAADMSEGILKSVADQEREDRAAGKPPRIELMEDPKEIIYQLRVVELRKFAENYPSYPINSVRIWMTELCDIVDDLVQVLKKARICRMCKGTTKALQYRGISTWVMASCPRCDGTGKDR